MLSYFVYYGKKKGERGVLWMVMAKDLKKQVMYIRQKLKWK